MASRPWGVSKYEIPVKPEPSLPRGSQNWLGSSYKPEYPMVFLKKSQLSILKIPHFHVSSVDFVDCLIVYNLWGKGNLRLRDFCRAGCEFEKRREVRGN